MINRAAVSALVAIDLRSVWRDPMLRWMAVLPVGIAVLLRVGIPLLTQELRERQGFDLSPYYLLIVSTLVLLMPAMVGMIAGFLLLDLRDDRTLSALQVTPLSVRGYLAYRLLLPMALSLPVTVLMVQFVGQVEIGIGGDVGRGAGGGPGGADVRAVSGDLRAQQGTGLRADESRRRADDPTGRCLVGAGAVAVDARDRSVLLANQAVLEPGDGPGWRCRDHERRPFLPGLAGVVVAAADR